MRVSKKLFSTSGSIEYSFMGLLLGIAAIAAISSTTRDLGTEIHEVRTALQGGGSIATSEPSENAMEEWTGTDLDHW